MNVCIVSQGMERGYSPPSRVSRGDNRRGNAHWSPVRSRRGTPDWNRYGRDTRGYHSITQPGGMRRRTRCPTRWDAPRPMWWGRNTVRSPLRERLTRWNASRRIQPGRHAARSPLRERERRWDTPRLSRQEWNVVNPQRERVMRHCQGDIQGTSGEEVHQSSEHQRSEEERHSICVHRVEPCEEEEVDFSVEPGELCVVEEEDLEEVVTGSGISGGEEAADLGSPTVSAGVNPAGSVDTSASVETQRVGEAARRSCPMCQKEVKKVFRHMMALHLPWFFSPETACWECRKEVGTLSKLAHHRKVHRCSTQEWSLGVWLVAMRQLLEELARMLQVRVQHVHLKAVGVPTPVGPLREMLLIFLEEVA